MKNYRNSPHSKFGYFWFSKEQEQVCHSQGDFSKRFCKIGGTLFYYTEWKGGLSSYDKSNWDDAIYLGHGYFDHIS